MKLHEGKSKEATWMGAFCSLMVLLVTISYTFQKIEVLVSKRDVDILSAIEDSFLSSEEVFGAEQGLQIAVSFVNFGDNFVDPSIGTLNLGYSKWGYREDSGEYYEELGYFPTRLCTKRELGLLGEAGARFNPIQDRYKSALENN